MKNALMALAAIVAVSSYVVFAAALFSDLQTVQPSVLKIVSSR